jgi:ArsR family transcriptional regulator
MSKQKKKRLAELTQMLRVMGDEKRLRILLTIREEEKNVTALCGILKMPQPSVSRHLGILRMGGLVTNRRDGKRIYYRLAELSDMECGEALKGLLDAAAARMG